MAISYRFRLSDVEYGPVGFRDLVRLVREELIGASDLVKADWELDWRPAAEVVGLFHMAGRADVLEKWEKERQITANDVGENAGLDNVLSQVECVEGNIASWQHRWMQVQERQKVLDAGKEQGRLAEIEEARIRQRIQVTISAAEAVLDQEKAGRRPSRIRRWKEAAFSSNSLHSAFRWGVTIAAANLLAFGIHTWSEMEAQRYPQRRNAPALKQQVFPFFGKCSSGEYLFLLADAMMMAGVLGYGAARVLESMADD